VEGEVPRVDVHWQDRALGEERAAAVARKKLPVIWSSCSFASKLVPRWSFAYLSKAFPPSVTTTPSAKDLRMKGSVVKRKEEEEEDDENGSLKTDPSSFGVSCSMDGKNRFFTLEACKNIYASFYHIREPENISLDKSVSSFSDFFQCARGWSEKHVHLKRLLMQRRSLAMDTNTNAKNKIEENYRAVMTPETMPDILLNRNENVAAAADGHSNCCVRRDLMNLLDWDWMFSFLRSQDFGSIRDVHLHCGTTNSLHPCRYQETDQLIAQVKGRTRLLLLSPKLAFKGLYPYPLHHPYDKHSMVDFEATEEENATLWPMFNENVRGLECILEPGQMLYVPQYYFIHSQDLDTEVVALQVAISQGRRIRSEEAIPLQVSRLLEERTAEVESMRDAHHWLSVIAHGEESEWIDTATVRGHRRIKFVESVHEEIELNLGKGSVSKFLKSMIDRRLMPTPWLNKKEFREPLYLLDKPFTLEDNRTELEKKYPEFFRTKLEKDGWNVPQAKSTVPIPGYNMPANADYKTYGLEGSS
jgi:hypothetical protein